MYKMRLALEPSDDEDDRLATVKLTLSKESSETELILFHFDYYFCDILYAFFEREAYYAIDFPQEYAGGATLAECHAFFFRGSDFITYYCSENVDPLIKKFVETGSQVFYERSITAGGGRGYPISHYALCNDYMIFLGSYYGKYEVSWEDVNGQFFQYEVDIPDFYQDLHKKYFHVFEKFLNGQPYSLR